MQISYFRFNEKNKEFEISSEFVSSEQLESSYDVKEVIFQEETFFPKAVYTAQNYGVFCFCDKNKKSSKEEFNYKLKFTISFKPDDSQNIFSEYYDVPIFLEVQNIFSNLLNAGVSLKKFFISDKNSFSFLIESSSIEKLRSDFYFSKFFIRKLYFSQNYKFIFGSPGKKDLEIQVDFGEDSEEIKKYLSEEFKNLNFSEQKMKHLFSNQENFIDSLFTSIISIST